MILQVSCIKKKKVFHEPSCDLNFFYYLFLSSYLFIYIKKISVLICDSIFLKNRFELIKSASKITFSFTVLFKLKFEMAVVVLFNEREKIFIFILPVLCNLSFTLPVLCISSLTFSQ